MKDVVIVANFVGALDGGKNSRFTYLADLLNNRDDIKVELISSSFSHDNKQKRDFNSSEFEYRITLIEEPGYKRNICLKRFYSHYVWGKNLKKYLKNRKTPDVVYCAVPSLTGSGYVAKYCNNNNVKFIIDIQDLWPEAFQMIVNIPLLNNLIFSPFRILANGIYKHADEICAVSQTYVKRALRVNKKTQFGHSVFLGTSLKTFDENAKKNRVIEKQKGDIWLAYCGTLGKSYDLISVFDALYLLNQKSSTVPTFIIMGDGPRRQEFEKYAALKKIKTVFTGVLSYKDMCAVLEECDMTVNPIIGTSVASIINKHADYAACGLPVLNTQNSMEYRNLVDSYNMGFNCESNNIKDLTEKIEILISDISLRKQMGENARKCAEERFDRRITYIELVNIITK